MKRIIISTVLTMLPLAAMAQTATSTAPASLTMATGAGIFQEYCASCHGRGLGHPGTTALAQSFGTAKASLLDRSDLSAALVKFVVRNGMGPMPSLRPSEISSNELTLIANYLAAGPHPADGAPATMPTPASGTKS